MKTALVMEGGAMRGMFTAGVMDVLMENNIEFDGGIGVSAGAAFGCNYKSRQIGRVLRYNLQLAKNWRYCSLRSLLLTGDLYGAEFCWHTVPEKINIMDTKTYEANPMKFYSVSTDVETGKAVYHDCEKLDHRTLEYMKSSASMPIAAKVVEIDGRGLLDGGISDSIPVQFMQDQGYDKQVVIMTQPKGYQKKPQKAMKMIRRVLRDYPAIVDALSTRHIRYNRTLERIAEMEREGSVLTIYPPQALEIGKIEHDREKILAVYRIGRETAKKELARIQRYLAE